MILYFLLGLVILGALFYPTRWDRAVSLVDYSYRFNSKKINDTKEIDCSGYVSYIVGLNLGSWELVEQAQNVLTTPRLTEDMFSDSTLVAYDSGDLEWDRGRSNGINHVGMEHDGQLYLCESALKLQGVVVRPLQLALKEWNSVALKNRFGEPYLDQTQFKTKQFKLSKKWGVR